MPEMTGTLRDPGLKEKRDKPGEHYYSFKVGKETFYLRDTDDALKRIVEGLAGKNVELTYTMSSDGRWKNPVSVQEVAGGSVIAGDDGDSHELHIIREACVKAAARLCAASIRVGKEVTPSQVIEAAQKFEIYVLMGGKKVNPPQVTPKAHPEEDEEPPPDEPPRLANLATDAQMARIRKELKARKIDTIDQALLDYLSAKFDIGDIGDLSKTQASTMIDAFQTGELW